MGQDGLDDVRVVLDPELVGDGQQQGVGGGDGLVLLELLDELVRLGRVASAEDRLGARVDVPDLVLVGAAAAEVGPVAVVGEREDGPADRDPGLAVVARFLPRLAVGLGSARPAGRGTACPTRGRSGWSSAGSCPSWPPRRRSSAIRRPTRCARGARPNTARRAAGRAGCGTSGAGSAGRSPRPSVPSAAPRRARGPCRRRSCPRAAGSRSSASRRSPARGSRG